MQDGEKRLAIVAVLSVANIPAFNIQFGAIWHAWGWNPRVNAALLALLAVWIAIAPISMPMGTRRRGCNRSIRSPATAATPS